MTNPAVYHRLLPSGENAVVTRVAINDTPVAPASSASQGCLQAISSQPMANLDPVEAPAGAKLIKQIQELGLFARAKKAESLEDLAQTLEMGSVAILHANAGLLWEDPRCIDVGEANHFVLARGVARDVQSRRLLGFWLRDPIKNEEDFHPGEKLLNAWLRPGGRMICVEVG